MESQN